MSISYARFDSQDGEEEEEEENARIRVAFSEFVEDTSRSGNSNASWWKKKMRLLSPGRRRPPPPVVSAQRRAQTAVLDRGPLGASDKAWSNAIKVLAVLVSFGIGWIFGFLVRWGVHRYYIDPLGHCTAPKVYEYSMAKSDYAAAAVNVTRIEEFFEFFANDDVHEAGSPQSEKFAKHVRNMWNKSWSLDAVSFETTKVTLPISTHSGEILVINSSTGDTAKKVALNKSNSAEVAYSGNGIAKGRLAYAQNLGGPRLNLNGSVALIGLSDNSRDYAGAVVLVAQLAGAVGVILFPAKDSSSNAKNLVVKFCPGDPHSPYSPSPESAVMPKIPVISVSRHVGKELLRLDQGNSTTVEFAVDVSERPNAVLRSVMGTIRGRYEPTRYVIVGAHHDTWKEGGGTKRAGLAHAALMELVRVFAMMKSKGMPPGRSIVFASWDGEQLGGLGSTSWMHEHSKELSSRAVAYVSIDDLYGISASPMVKGAIESAAASVPLARNNLDSGREPRDTLLTVWSDGKSELDMMSSALAFQTLLGISSVKVGLKLTNRSSDGDPNYADFEDASNVVKFLVDLLMRLTSSPKIPLSAQNYAHAIGPALDKFLTKHGDALEVAGDDNGSDLKKAVARLTKSAEAFHFMYDDAADVFGSTLTFLADHEYSDQLMELERSFLLPPAALNAVLDPAYRHLRHAISGPSPTPINAAEVTVFPRLAAAIAALRAANITGDAPIGSEQEALVQSVQRELFYVTDGLEAASCVLDNHVVWG